ncbi:phosphatidate phosphatase App1 family protein [Endothiovibrio diazotrophicus]
MIPPDRYEESFVSILAEEESVYLYPTAGHWDEQEGHWVASIHGWIFRPLEEHTRRARFLKLFRKSLGIRRKEVTENFLRRAEPFLVECLERRVLRIELGGERYTLDPSGHNGHFHSEILIPPAIAGTPQAPRRVEYSLVLVAGDRRVLRGTIHLLPPRGVSVVSDIDDTLKVSEVASKRRLLANTFIHEFRPVEGMERLLREWGERGASLHYVSSTPWQLYDELTDFFERLELPGGTFHLKKFRWRDRSFFDLLASPKRTKRKVLEPLFNAFPERRFVLLGDSAEKDPEIYAQLAADYPQQVAAILIRDLDGATAEAKRYRKAFKGLPEERFRVFHDTVELGGFELPRVEG